MDILLVSLGLGIVYCVPVYSPSVVGQFYNPVDPQNTQITHMVIIQLKPMLYFKYWKQQRVAHESTNGYR